MWPWGAYILLSVAGCLAGVALGQALARRAGSKKVKPHREEGRIGLARVACEVCGAVPDLGTAFLGR